MDPEVAISLISLENSHFATDIQVISEILELLQNVCNCQKQIIITNILKYYQSCQQNYFTQVSQNIKALLSANQISANLTPAQFQSSGADTPSRKSQTYRREIVSNNIILKNLQNKQKQQPLDHKIAYIKQIEDSPFSFTKPIQPKITFSDGCSELLEYQLKIYAHLAQRERQLGLEDFDIIEPSLQFIFPENRQCYVRIQVPQIHPTLLQILAPPSQFFPNFFCKSIEFSYSNKQLDVQYSNEIQDDPDLKLIPNLMQVQMRTYRDPVAFHLFRNINFRLVTQKPTPQHHTFIDLPGVYAPLAETLESLKTELTIIYKSHAARGIPFTAIDIISRIQHIVYFAPFDMCVDQRCFGNESRFVRFKERDQVTCYLKAVGVGGGIRLQLQAARDLGAEEELSLGFDYMLLKNQKVYSKLQYLYDQFHLIGQQQPWLKIIDQSFKKGSQEYYKYVDISIGTFYITIMNQELVNFPELIDSIADLQQWLDLNVRSCHYNHKDVLVLENILSDAPADAFTLNKNNIIGVSREEVINYSEVGNIIMKNLLANNSLADVKFQELIKLMHDDFINFIQNYSMQRLYSFFNFILSQTKFSLQQNQRDDINYYLEQLNKPLLTSHIYIKTYPTFYANFFPFSGFDPATYQCFDRGLDKLMISVQDLARRRFKESFATVDGMSDEVLNRILLKFMQQNVSFNLLMQGASISVDQYYNDVIAVLHEKLYIDVDYIISEIIPINEDKLQSFQKSKDIKLFMEAFREPKFNYQRLFVTALDPNITRYLGEDLIKFMCQEIMDILDCIPTLNKKIKYDVKQQTLGGVQWPGSVSGFSKVGYDGAYGYKYQRDPKMIVSDNIQRLIEPKTDDTQTQKEPFKGALWDFLRARQQAEKDGKFEFMMSDASLRHKKKIQEFIASLPKIAKQ